MTPSSSSSSSSSPYSSPSNHARTVTRTRTTTRTRTGRHERRPASVLLYIPRGVRIATVVSALAVALLAGRAARAAGEREWQVALRAGAGTVSVDGRKPWGLAGGLDVEYGLTDAWAVRLSFEG